MERFALGACAAAAMLLLVWVLSRCRSGFDFTDEGFYLNWISSPWDYSASVSQFGFAYHPLYRLVGGDIALLRQANVLIIFASAFALCAILLHSIVAERIDGRSAPRIWIVALALVIAASSLTFFDLWLPTPGYNSLTFTSLMFAAIGVLMTSREASTLSLMGWVMIGTAGALSFLAKPTSAALLGCAVVVYLVIARKLWMRGLVISILAAAALLGVSALAIDGSIGTFVDRVLEGARIGSLLTPDQPIARMFRIDSFNFSREQRVNFALLLVVAFIATSLATRANAAARIAAALLALVFAGLSISVSGGALAPHISYEPFQPMQFWAVSLALVLFAMLSPRRSYRALSRNSLALVVFFIVLPHVYAFGTGNNYWEQAGRAGLFWLLAGLVLSMGLLAGNAAWRNVVPIAAAALLVPTGVLFAAMENPYRQAQPLRLQKTAVEIGSEKSSLLLTREAAAYIRQLRKIAAENGFKAGDPTLDLSGVSPGSVYAIGARAPGAGWLLAGYSGSNDFFNAALDRVGCEPIVASWILTERTSPNALSSDLLRRYGIDFSHDYVEVGSLRSVRSFSPREFESRLLKPVRTLDVAREACELAKRAAG
ncbi:hypothetical protein [Bradyrhizobium icense]|uniref:Glycosyltransferase RgtA/B/C/D-like domain-containing protein n=1 Tax=Bradyrhizobium icense TaxID=1274631 RepID=A0A1B1UCT3_9BRAD|nr:hypothetical protein [Bradyrhizobium icense]ANW00568.1 hypothetical protein LMTR13_10730 [Bradyrhizobium icense]